MEEDISNEDSDAVEAEAEAEDEEDTDDTESVEEKLDTVFVNADLTEE
jgi:hypothetical protein